MIEVVAAFARWFQLTANITVLGSCVFLAIIGNVRNSLTRPWIERIDRFFPWLVISTLVGLLLILVTTAGQASGSLINAVKPDVLLDVLQDTRMGHIWLGRVTLVFVLLAVVFYFRNKTRTRWRYLLCATFATFPLIAGSLASHTAAEELSFIAVLPYALHIILAGIWLGALPALLFMLSVFIKQENSTTNTTVKQTFQRFSSIAFPIMLLIVVTGFIVADRTFDDSYAAIFATPYGWILNAKLVILAIILMIATSVRSNWLPRLIQSEGAERALISAKHILKLVRVEYILALGLLLLATILSNTTPAKHAPIDEWPLPFRLSFDATWGVTSVMIQFWIGVVVFLAACAAIRLGRIKKWNLKRLIFIPLALMITSLAIALPPIAIEAYPETYQKTPVPYDAVSIANGEKLYRENCVACHGPQGKGNGILSRTLSTLLPDMLMEPHVEAHTAGDLYHWITFGMEDTDMPGYADKLTEEDRWDLVNFFHALYRGYQSRILTPEIVPNKPFIIPPSFYYGTNDGSGGVLQDFREQNTVLLVLFSWPESKDRLKQLSVAYEKFNKKGTAILAVPKGNIDIETIEQIANVMPFPIVTQGAAEIVSSYALSRRTLSHPDIIGSGKVPDHMEFLIDQHGYLRARWIPSADEFKWNDIDALIKQISLLNQESIKIPPPDDYVY
jgi:putative copper export protein/mono/diheme cytochrome c family protein/peroxiredoxin